MKKFLTVVMAVALLLSTLTLSVINTAAEEAVETSFKFGSAEVALTLIDNLNSAEGSTWQGWGSLSVVDQMLKLELDNLPCNDSYGIKTGMLSADTDFTGAVNLVFSVKDNRSDGDIFFSIQPHSPSLTLNEGNLFTGWVEGQTVWLVDTNGRAKEAKKCPSVDLMSGRAGYVLPMGFEGYIVFPVANFVIHGDWANSYYVGDATLDIDALGFHISKDDATYAEVSFDDLYTCGELPALDTETKPAETTAPETAAPETAAPETAAPETAAPETAAPETAAPETNAPETAAPETNAPEVDTTAETKADTTADTVAETEAPKKEGGCGAVVGGLVALPVALLGAAVLRRRED